VPSDEIHGFRNTTAQARLLVTATEGLAVFCEEVGLPLPGTPASAEPPSAEENERMLAISRKHDIRFLRQEM
jgi:hypothetical protein